MICNVSKATATRYLGGLEAEWLDKIASTGVITVYIFKGLSKGSKKGISNGFTKGSQRAQISILKIHNSILITVYQ